MTPKEFATKIRSKYPGSYDHVDDVTLSQKVVAKYPEYQSAVQFDAPKPQEGSFQEIQALKGLPMGQKVWQGLQVPSQMASRGLNDLSDRLKPSPEITGNLTRDLVMNFPSVEAKIGAEAAPAFINRASLLTGGIARGLQGTGKLIAPFVKGAASHLEDLSGIAPKAQGALTDAYNDSSLLFAKGKKAAGKLYEAAKSISRREPEQVAGKFVNGMFEMPSKEKISGLKATLASSTATHREVVNAAEELLKHDGLSSEEALTARKSVDELIRKRGAPLDNLFETRKALSRVTDSNQAMSEADRVFQRGIKAEALRKPLPQNKYGGASAFKLYVAEHLPKSLQALFSPLAMGVGATAAGAAGRNVVTPLIQSPKAASAVAALLQLRDRKNENPNPQ